MTGTRQLRAAVTGLLSFAAAEEQMLLAEAAWDGRDEGGGPDRWAAAPLVAHDNHFKNQQAERIRAIQSGQVPPASGEIDHSSAEVYRDYRAQQPEDVLAECRRVSAELIDGTWALPDQDLLDPARYPWLNGRLFWLQIVVRGFWHPTGHLGAYYLGHDQPERAIALQEQGVATARYLGAPAAAAGMAGYSLACVQARSGQPDQAVSTLAAAVEANPDLRVNVSTDPDLAALRAAGRLEAFR
ncbi:MAG: TPR end-of-group domain-containing protein [Streptosporangiaceae bacterium]